MSLYEIRILNAAGTQLGDGPITSATDWTHTANLDQAGQFAFTMPRDDPRSRYIRPKRVAQCWGFVDGAWQHLGSGIINDAQTIISDDGRAMLQVTGDNLLAELLNRIIRASSFSRLVDVHPARVWFGLTSAAESIDFAVGDTSSWTVHNDGDGIIIESPVRFNRIDFVLHSPQTNGGDATISFQTRDGTGDAEWTDFTAHVTNTTLTTAGTASVWFGQSGAITWDIDDLSGWELRDADAVPGVQRINYLIRIAPGPATSWTAFEVADISIRVTQETNDALEQIMAYAPTGWTLDAGNGYTALQSRPLGEEILPDGGLETYTGTPNDATSDNWLPFWATTYLDDANGDSVLADTAVKHSGAASVKITHGATGNYSGLFCWVDAEPTTEYTISYWTRSGANSGQVALALMGGNNERFYIADSLVTGTTWTKVTYTFNTPIDSNQLGILFYAPTADNSSAYIDDVSLRLGGGKSITLDTQGETVLENLVRISETTGEHFIASPTPRQVLWLGKDVRNSEVRAIAHTDPLAVEGHDDICLIQSLVEVASGVDLISRVYPYGGGSDPVPTLITTTRPIPDGYELDRDNNCLTRTQSVAAYGLIERRLDLPDVTNVSGDTSGGIHGANMVFDRALLYLQRHSATNLALDGGDFPRSYQLQLLKCSRVLMPGYTLHIEYDRYVAGTRTMHVDGDFWITSATVRVDASGVHTVAVTCSTVDQAPRDNNSFVVDLARRVRGMKAHR